MICLASLIVDDVLLVFGRSRPKSPPVACRTHVILLPPPDPIDLVPNESEGLPTHTVSEISVS